jgi:hypothetical protein
MLYPPEQEQKLLASLLAFRDDPLGFALYAWPWGEKGTPLERFPRPWSWQVEELVSIRDHLARQEERKAATGAYSIYRMAVSAGRGPGKTALLAMLAIWHVTTHLGAQVIVAANTEAQLKTKTFAEISRWISLAIHSHWWEVEGLRIYPRRWLAEKVSAPMDRGGLGIDERYWTIQGQTWNEENPSAFAGAHNAFGLMLIFDEASGIPAEVWDTADGFFTDDTPYRFWLVASQMRSRTGRFYQLFNDPRMGHGWKLRSMSVRGLEGVDQNWVEEKIAQFGLDSDFVRVEILGLAPGHETSQFIPMAHVEAAFRNQFPPDPGEPLILGVDPAPRGRTTWRFRQGRNARNCCWQDTWGELDHADNVEIAMKVLELVQKHKPDAVVVDFGMGTGVIDVLKRNGVRPIEVRFGDAPVSRRSEWATRGSELWAMMREWLPNGMLEASDALARELTNRTWRWYGREDGRKILESKASMKARGVGSPDAADALALTFAASPVRRDSPLVRGIRPMVADGVDASPFGF